MLVKLHTWSSRIRIQCEVITLKLKIATLKGNKLNESKFYSGRIKIRMMSGNACFHSVQNLLSSSFLPKNIKIKIHRTIILPVVYVCQTWSVTLREERWLRVFDYRVLKRIFGPKKNEITRKCRKLHNVERKGLYSSPNIIWAIKCRRMKWAGV
jgi:hypothetical protein